jgi:hypothetical protein
MRRLWLASCVLLPLLPGLALAQAANTPPSAAPAGLASPQDDDGMMGGPDMMGPGGWQKGHDHHEGMGPAKMLMDFYAANTTHDGHLTLAQAKAASLQPVVDNFTAMDVKHHGYVTYYDIMAWRLDDMAKHLEQKADELRAQD